MGIKEAGFAGRGEPDCPAALATVGILYILGDFEIVPQPKPGFLLGTGVHISQMTYRISMSHKQYLMGLKLKSVCKAGNQSFYTTMSIDV